MEREFDYDTLAVERDGSRLHVTLNRPAVRNAMSFVMVGELIALVDAVRDRRDVRTLVLRGAGGHFCAGGDIQDMAAARQMEPSDDGDPLAEGNRRFGALLERVGAAPQAVVAVLQGAVLGGGFGLACVADVAIAAHDARFGLPETSLGLPPAQIAPFIVERLGLSEARRLAVTGGRFDGREAGRIGLVHFVCEGEEALSEQLDQVLGQIDRCAPEAVATTKRLVLESSRADRSRLLDEAATAFAGAVRGPEGIEGTVAFLEKRPPSWASSDA